jgi:hypothetical protein
MGEVSEQYRKGRKGSYMKYQETKERGMKEKNLLNNKGQAWGETKR